MIRRISAAGCALIVALGSSAFAQYLNPSFETPGGTLPSFWEQNSVYTDAASSISYQQGGGAADGTSFLRITTVSAKPVFTYCKAISPLNNTALEPNCNYRFTVAVRRNAADLLPVVSLDESGGASLGNLSALEYFSPGVAEVVAQSTDPLNTWYDLTFDYTTGVAGIYSKSWWIKLTALADAFPNLPSGSTADFDNVRLVLLSRNSNATLTVGTGASVQDFSNTDCRIQFTSNTASGTIAVAKNTGTPDNLGTAIVPGKYWTITSSLGGTFAAKPVFSYTDLELSGAGMSEADLHLLRRPVAGGTWSEVPATLNTSLNMIQPTTSVSSFSQWAIASSGFGATAAEDWLLYN